MKKIGLVFILACGWQTAAYAQKTLQTDVLKVGGSSSEADRKKNGIEIGDAQRIQIGEWEKTTTLSFAVGGYNFTGGNVGIGTTNPTYKLDVNGGIRAKSVGVEDFVAAYGNLGLVFAKTLETTTATVTGDATINGTLHARNVMFNAMFATSVGAGVISTKSAVIDGNLQATNATINGTLQGTNATFSGRIWGKSATIDGIATVNGTFYANNALIDGMLQATGAVINGPLVADEISVTPTAGADFVFNNDYHLRPLSEVNHFIRENKHLPEIPSAAEMTSKGVAVGEMQMKLLQKIEEFTLYMIKQEEKIDALNAKIEKLENDKN